MFYSPKIGSQSFGEPVPLGGGLHRWPYFFFDSLGETGR